MMVFPKWQTSYLWLITRLDIFLVDETEEANNKTTKQRTEIFKSVTTLLLAGVFMI